MLRSPRLALLAAFTAAWLCDPPIRAEDPAKPVATATLHNVFQLDDRLYSGDAPEDEAAFRELSALGVKTIISVDGSRPRLALAQRFGMRYIHLPFGYDALPQPRGTELAQAAHTAAAAGPIYLHCHHGKHRGPAAAATICRALDAWSVEKADAFLKQAGTAPDYAGLYRDVRAFRPPDRETLAHGPKTFPESADTPALVDTMVAIDEKFDALKAAQKTGWREIPATGHSPAPTAPQKPAEVAILLWENFRELARDPDTAQRGADYALHLATSERYADTLRQLLADPASDRPARDTTWQQLSQSCTACHRAHRN